METRITIGKRLLALTLALVYVFATSTYIVFLSSRMPVHHHHHQHAAGSQTQHLTGGAAGNFFDKQHGAFKSIRQNKPKVISSLYGLIWLVVLAMGPTLRLFYVSRFTGVLSGLRYAGCPYYLSLRVLRI